MRSRMSLMLRPPNSASKPADPHQKSRWRGWSRRSIRRSPDGHVNKASSTTPARPAIRSARSRCEGARATSHTDGSLETRAWMAGNETTRSPSPNDTGARKVRASSARMRRGPVFDTRLGERLAALSTFVATLAMSSRRSGRYRRKSGRAAGPGRGPALRPCSSRRKVW